MIHLTASCGQTLLGIITCTILFFGILALFGDHNEPHESVGKSEQDRWQRARERILQEEQHRRAELQRARQNAHLAHRQLHQQAHETITHQQNLAHIVLHAQASGEDITKTRQKLNHAPKRK